MNFPSGNKHRLRCRLKEAGRVVTREKREMGKVTSRINTNFPLKNVIPHIIAALFPRKPMVLV